MAEIDQPASGWMERLRRGPLRPIVLLMTGTALAQAAPVLVSPVLTRLYAPEAFGALAWAVSLVTVASLLASGTYGQAVNLPPDRMPAAALAAGVGLTGSLVAFAAAMASMVEWQWRHVLLDRMWFVPAAILLTAWFSAAAAWANREARFGLLARARVSMALVGVSATLLFGALDLGATGLMSGNLLGLAGGCTVFAQGLLPDSLPLLRVLRRRDLTGAWFAYRSFPSLLLPSSLLNTLTNQMPVWFIERLFGTAVLGQYALMNRVLNVPVALISSSVGEVFKQRAAAEYRETGQCRHSFDLFARGLGAASFFPALALLLAGPQLFALVFGDMWRSAGHFAQILAVMFALRCAVSPLSYVVIVAQRQKLNIGLQVLCLLSAITAWWVGAWTGSPEIALGVFGGIYAATYLVYLFLSYRLSHGPLGPVAAVVSPPP